MLRRSDSLKCDATFRVREDFGKDIDAWPDDIRVALRRAILNFRVGHPEAGREIEQDVQFLNVPKKSAIGFPWVVRVSVLFEKAIGH